MKDNGLVACCVGLCFVAVATIMLEYGQISAEVSPKGGDGIVVKIDTSKSNYVLGEPLHLIQMEVYL